MLRAISFANNNAQFNNFKKKPSDPVVTPALCAIFAKSSANWRTALRKVFLHEVLVGDSSDPAKKAAKETGIVVLKDDVMLPELPTLEDIVISWKKDLEECVFRCCE